AALLVVALTLAAPPAMAGSSADEMKNCPAQDWCSYHRAANTGWRYSPLDQVNTRNVKQLRPVWIFQPGEVRMGLQSTPLVVDGYMYVSTNPSTVWKLNAKTGQRGWAYVPQMDEAIIARSFFAHTRGVAWGGGGSRQPRTVDYDNNQILIGVGNPDPDYEYCGGKCLDPNADGWRPGGNLYTSSTVALDLNTGKLNWYFQEAPGDPYDYDASPGEYVLFEDGRGRKLVLHPGKNGFNQVHDRKTGQPLSVYPDMKSFNWTSGFNLET